MSFNFRWKGLARQSGATCACGCVTTASCPDCSTSTPANMQLVGNSWLNSFCGSGCPSLNATFLLPLKPGGSLNDFTGYSATCAWKLTTSISICSDVITLWCLLSTNALTGWRITVFTEFGSYSPKRYYKAELTHTTADCANWSNLSIPYSSTTYTTAQPCAIPSTASPSWKVTAA